MCKKKYFTPGMGKEDGNKGRKDRYNARSAEMLQNDLRKKFKSVANGNKFSINTKENFISDW